jgi:hypothetical protein
MADFNVQRMTAAISSGANTVTLSAGTDYTAPTDETKAFVRLMDTHRADVPGSPQSAVFTQARVDQSAGLGTSFVTRVNTAGQAGSGYVELLEYVGAVGGANEIVVRAAGSVTFTTETSKNGATVAGVVTDADVVVAVTGVTNAGSNLAAGLFTAQWDAANQQPTFVRGNTAAGAVVSYVVLELTGSNWTVQDTGDHAFSAGETQENLTVSSVGATVATGFVIPTFRLTNVSASGRSVAYRAWLSSPTNVAVMTGASTAELNGQTIRAYVIANPDLVVEHVNGAFGGTAQTAITVTTVADAAQTSVVLAGVYFETQNNAADPGFCTASAYLHDTATVYLERTSTNETMSVRFQVVQWPTAGGGGGGGLVLRPVQTDSGDTPCVRLGD